jgi:hypothetical protein
VLIKLGRFFIRHYDFLGVLFGIDPETVVLAGSLQDELAFMRTRRRWPNTVPMRKRSRVLTTAIVKMLEYGPGRTYSSFCLPGLRCPPNSADHS